MKTKTMNSTFLKFIFLFCCVFNFSTGFTFGNSNPLFIADELLLSCEPISSVFECAGQNQNAQNGMAWNEDNITSLTNCGSSDCGDIIVTSDYDLNNFSDECGSSGFIRVIYTISDGCNSLIKSATFRIADITEPILDCEPDDIIIECSGDAKNKANIGVWNQQNISKLVLCASDLCGTITITSDYNYNNIDIYCGLIGSILVTYTITDKCGNFITKSASFTVKDETFPSSSCDPTSETHECNGLEGNHFASLAWNQNNGIFQKTLKIVDN